MLKIKKQRYQKYVSLKKQTTGETLSYNMKEIIPSLAN
jgi:hypothetical protein